MPFTLAHPAAVVPLGRADRRLDLVALVVGSLMPDLPYMLLVGPSREVTHTLGASVWFAVPTGIVALAFARRTGLQVLRGVLPAGVRRRIPPQGGTEAGGTVRRWTLAVGCLWLGALTHVAWDAFTHSTSPLVQSSAFLRTTLFTVGGIRLEVFNLLQHGGTALGLLLLTYWAYRWLQASEPRDDIDVGPREWIRRVLLWVLVFVPVMAGIGAALPRLSEGWSVPGFTIAASTAGFTHIATLTYTFLGITAVWWLTTLDAHRTNTT